MIGMVLVTHGALAHEFKSALEHVVGPQDHVETIAIGPEDDMEQRREDIVRAVDAADQGQGVVILTDMFGGTPSNLAISLLEEGKIEVVAGLNLPMLVRALNYASLPLEDLAHKAETGGRDGVLICASQQCAAMAEIDP